MGSCPPLLAPSVSSPHLCQHRTLEHDVSWACISNPRGAMKLKKVIIWNSCFAGQVVLSAGHVFGDDVKKHVCVRGKIQIIPAICTEVVSVKCRARKGSGGMLITTPTKGSAVQTLHNLFVSKPASCVLLFPSWVVYVLSFWCHSWCRKAENESYSNLGISAFPGSPEKHLFPVKIEVVVVSARTTNWL